MDNKPSQWKMFFEVGSTVVMLALAGGLLWSTLRPSNGSPAQAGAPYSPPLPNDPIEISDAPVRGSRTAPIAIVEFGDFSCSACAAFAKEVEPALRKEYIDTGRVMFVYKTYPRLGGAGADTAAASWCAAQQGKFWQLHDGWFSLAPPSGRGAPAPRVNQAAESLQSALLSSGSDMQAIEACQKSQAVVAAVAADRQQGEVLEVSGTPTFFFGTVNGQTVKASEVMLGVRSTQSFRNILNKLLSQ